VVGGSTGTIPGGKGKASSPTLIVEWRLLTPLGELVRWPNGSGEAEIGLSNEGGCTMSEADPMDDWGAGEAGKESDDAVSSVRGDPNSWLFSAH